MTHAHPFAPSRLLIRALAVVLAAVPHAPAGAQTAKPHNAGDTLFENDALVVAGSPIGSGQWCFPVPRVRGENQANLSLIYKGGPDADFSATEEYQQLVETTLWPLIESLCQPNLTTIRAESYVRGVRIGNRDMSELTYADKLLPDEREVALYRVFIRKTPRGLQFTPGSTGAPTTLTAFRAKNAQDTLNAGFRESRGLAVAQADAEKTVRAQFMRAAAFDTTGLRDPDFFRRVFHGQFDPEWEPTYRFRLAFATFMAGFAVRCPEQLPPDADLIGIYEPVYGELTTTWMTGSGFTWTTSMPVQTGTRRMTEVRVARRFSTKVWAYTHDSSMTGVSDGGSGLSILDVFDPERAAETARIKEDNLADLVTLLDLHACASTELAVLAENLHRVSQHDVSLQDEAIRERAKQIAMAAAVSPRLTEGEVFAAFARGEPLAGTAVVPQGSAAPQARADTEVAPAADAETPARALAAESAAAPEPAVAAPAPAANSIATPAELDAYLAPLLEAHGASGGQDEPRHPVKPFEGGRLVFTVIDETGAQSRRVLWLTKGPSGAFDRFAFVAPAHTQVLFPEYGSIPIDASLRAKLRDVLSLASDAAVTEYLEARGLEAPDARVFLNTLAGWGSSALDGSFKSFRDDPEFQARWSQMAAFSEATAASEEATPQRSIDGAAIRGSRLAVLLGE